MEDLSLMDELAVDVSLDERQGGFLRTFALAWQKADRENKMLLFPVWAVLIEKYGLDEECERVRGREVKR